MTRTLLLCGALATLPACDGNCRNVATDRDTVSGTVVYQPASTNTPFTFSEGRIWSVGRSSLEVDIGLRSESSVERTARISLSGLTPGPSQALTGSTLGQACLVLQTAAAPTCLTLTGTVDVRRLDSDCYNHESGVSLCADNVDVSLHASTDDNGVSMQLTLDIVRAEHWTSEMCRDD
jgi:hypothetical protein